ncbi:MAG: LytTR family transcriptional regulator [Clostridiales Family XIII bacterium]|nr:LytTR family transcriptional regulator [Clostridiales Family XIII bacterium]
MKSKIIVKNRFITACLDLNEILYVAKELRKVIVYTDEKQYWEYCVMERILDQADERIYRCHHSLAVNMDKIHEITGDGVILCDERELNMCRSALQGTKKAWGKYLEIGRHR